MKVILSTIGKFHTFDLARELDKRNVLGCIYTGYPNFKLTKEGIPANLIQSFPYFHAPYMKMPWDFFGNTAKREWEYWDRVSFDSYVAKNIPVCDVFSGLSGSAIKTAKVVKSRNGVYLCDRGSCHIQEQNLILEEEHDRWGLKYNSIDPRIIERELAEYDLADAITVPSTFAYNTFLSRGVPSRKLFLVPYGVDLQKFGKVSSPHKGTFDVLFVGGGSLQKGVPDLLNAYKEVCHPHKTLTMVGSFPNSFKIWLKNKGLLSAGINFTGHVPQYNLKELMSRSHVMVLPSIQEGFGMVQAQALACGCPVIATQNTGAQDLFNDNIEGFIVPIRNPSSIVEKLQFLADNTEIRELMSAKALAKVRNIGGWSSYGSGIYLLMKSLL